jgi:hypothetical protein
LRLCGQAGNAPNNIRIKMINKIVVILIADLSLWHRRRAGRYPENGAEKWFLEQLAFREVDDEPRPVLERGSSASLLSRASVPSRRLRLFAGFALSIRRRVVTT